MSMNTRLQRQIAGSSAREPPILTAS